MKSRTVIWVVGCVCGLVLFGCQSSDAPLQQMKGKLQQWYDGLMERGPSSAAGDPVVAQVGPLVIRSSDVRETIKGLPPQRKAALNAPGSRDELLEVLINIKVWAVAALRAGVDKDPVFRKNLAQVKEKMLTDAYIRRFAGNDLAVSGAEIEYYYRTHPKEFAAKTVIRVRRIRVKTLEEARKVQGLSKTTNFEHLALKYSLDSFAERGVQVPMTIGENRRDVEAALLSMRIGEISPIFPAPGGGFVLFRKEGQIEWPARSLESAREEIRERLVASKRPKLRENIQKTIPIKINKEALYAIPLPPAEPSAGYDGAGKTMASN